MHLEEWKRSGQDYDHRGYHIFYRDQGTGPALLCIHGFPTASWDWSRLWPELAARSRCIAPDMLGFGFSSKPRPYAYSILDQADLHEGLCRSLGVDEVDVLAHDYGDTVAQELLARHEERRARGEPGLRLRSVCLLNGGLFPEAHRPRLVQRLLASPIGAWLGRLYDEGKFRRSFRPLFGAATQPTDHELREFWELIQHNDGLAVQHLLIRYLDERRRHRPRWVGALERTAVPVRFVCGADDPVSGRHMADRYRQLVPRPDVVLLEQTGHYPQVERPDQVLEAFLPFAARRPG
jgi:pimeloyl-ACP methyl ester carboxylesterase